MRILFVAPRYHTNQVEIVRALLRRGHEVRFHAALRGVQEDHSLVAPEVVPESRFSSLIRRLFGDGDVNNRRYFPDPLAYWRAFRKASPDVVVIRFHGAVFSYLAALFARLSGCRVVFYQQMGMPTLLGIRPRGFRPFLRWLNFRGRLALFDAAWMTPIPAPAGAAADMPASCYFVPFAVPASAAPPARGPVVRFLVVGKYQARKNHLLMVKAAAALAGRYAFTVTLIGEASTREHERNRAEVSAAIESLGLGKIVTMKESVPYAAMGRLYGSHDVFVLPSSNEPAAISLLEALGQGLPVICSDSCGTRTYVLEGETGYVFRSDDASSLAGSLEKMLAQPGSVPAMSANALRYAKERLSQEEYLDRFSRMLRKEFGVVLSAGAGTRQVEEESAVGRE